MKNLAALAVLLAANIPLLNAGGIPDGWKRLGDKGSEPRLVDNMLELSGSGSAIVWRVPGGVKHHYKGNAEGKSKGKGGEAVIPLGAR